MKSLVMLAVFVLAVSACGEGDSLGEPTSFPRPDGDWELVSGVDLVPDYPVTMSIAANQISGRAACNGYGGTVTVNGAALAIGELAQTGMGCEPAVMAAESSFMLALAEVDSWRFDGDRLVLEGSTPRLEFAEVAPVPTDALVGTTWMLDTLIEGEAASTVGGEPATLLLSADGTLTASTGCRELTGKWNENGGVIIVPELSANGDCPDELWKQDSLVVTVIGDEFSAVVEGDNLTLTSMGGDGLVYRSS